MTNNRQTTNKHFGTLHSNFETVGPIDAGLSPSDAFRRRARIDT